MTCILPLGMHRSGTSLVAGILKRLDVDMGEELRPADEWNPTGYVEDTTMRDISRRLLQASGGWWVDPPKRHVILSAMEGFQDEITREIGKRTARGSTWGWKDPRLCLTLPAFDSHLEGLKLILVNRSRTDTARSLLRRELERMRWRPERDEEFWRRLYDHYLYERDLVASAHHKMKVCYEDLTDRDLSHVTIRRIADYVGYTGDISNALSIVRFKNEE